MNYKHTKQEFQVRLLPVMDLLDHKRSVLPHEDWIAFTGRTKTSIVNNPIQFLGQDLPDKEITTELVESIFSEYIAREEISG